MPFKTLILLILVLSAFSSPEQLQQARSLFIKAGTDKVYAEKLQTLTASRSDALLKAYYGSSWTLLAKHHPNPVKKLEFLKKGLAEINAAVLLDAADIEIRFIRFSVEDNIPAIVPFSSHISADKKMLLDNLNSRHPVYQTIKSYLLQSDNLSAEEKALIRG